MPIYALGDREPDISADGYVHPDAVIIGSVSIGEGASIWPGAVLRGDHGSITIGRRTSIQDGTIIHVTAQWPTTVADDCVVGHNAHLEGCTVETRSLIGSGSVVLNRARIGPGSVVGAAALVPEDFVVPPGQLAVGVPARLRPLPAQHEDWVDYAVRTYVESARHYRQALRRLD